MIRNSLAWTWAMSIGAGLCVAAGIALARNPTTTPMHVFLAQAGATATVAGALMFVSLYADIVRPARRPPPPPGFAQRRLTWRDRVLGDGRPDPVGSTRARYILSAIGGGFAGWLIVIGITRLGFLTVGPGSTVLFISTVHALRTRYRSRPRPPYSTWLERHRSGGTTVDT